LIHPCPHDLTDEWAATGIRNRRQKEPAAEIPLVAAWLAIILAA
jgi:hypothetical protein